jgi:hypothetical protein
MSNNKVHKIIMFLAIILLMLVSQASNFKINQAILSPGGSGEILITVDNVLTKILVNGKPISLNVPGLDDWPQVKKIEANLHSGDIIEITGSNFGKPTSQTGGNPAAILASFTYTDSHGKIQTISTNSNWNCNGQVAMTLGYNGVAPWGDKAPIANNAAWIWDLANAETATCSYKLPDQQVPKSMIFITVDNMLSIISVNGKPIPLNVSGLDNWGVVKKIEANLHSGDLIEITGSNFGGEPENSPIRGNPAATLASITYTDRHGVEQTISTDDSWNCNGKKALVLGPNGMEPWGAKAPIATNAQWIWDSANAVTATCSFRLPALEDVDDC